MVVVRVKDRGRDVAVHVVESLVEARELSRVYELLGYAPDKIAVQAGVDAVTKAA